MKIALSQLTNSILGSSSDLIISTSKKPIYTVVANHPLLATLETENTRYAGVFGKETYSGMGITVVNADLFRDGCASGIKSILLGYSKLQGFEFQQDAIDLYTLFENRGEFNSFSYLDQSNEMEKLISDLEKPENALKLEHLNLTLQFGMMKAAQNDFKIIYTKQIGANSELRLEKSASATRHSLEAAIRNYLNIVEAMKSIPGWFELFTELSEVVLRARNSQQDTPPEQTPPAVV